MSFMIGVRVYESAQQFFFEENISIDAIVWLSACTESVPRPLEDMFEYIDGTEHFYKIFPRFPERNEEDLLEDIEDNSCLLVEELVSNGYEGFLVKARTPVPVEFGESKEDCTAYSFSFTSSTLLYVPVIDNTLLEELMIFKKGVVDDAWEKFSGKKDSRK